MQETYDQSRFDGAKPYCDIVMKGGITSGVVYPLAVVELATKYRIKGVGGTSAGALAAVIVAAAEYGRDSGGYLRIAEIPNEVSQKLLTLFQPEPRFRPLFAALTAALRSTTGFGKALRASRAFLCGYPMAWVPWTLPGLAILAWAFAADSTGLGAFGILLAVVCAAVGAACRLIGIFTKELPEANYGLCTGMTVDGSASPALTEWLADKIDEVAGMERTGGAFTRPLTFGDLARRGHADGAVELATITTDLMSRRPYRLPFRDNLHCFSRAEFDTLFPRRIVDHMVGNTRQPDWAVGRFADIHFMPAPEHLPVVVAARLSLSFPGLIQAVPIYRIDYTLRTDDHEPRQPVRCLFSDGGLSSNFPIHFFDSVLPRRPTFAIALEEFNEQRHRERASDDSGGWVERRVWMNRTAGSGLRLPTHAITGLPDFLMTLLDAAKDWQDNLQSTLPGYRERIVHIALKPNEGGLNLTMPSQLVLDLVGLGRRAGETIVGGQAAAGDFDFDDHRWRRFLVAMARFEDALMTIAERFDNAEDGGESFADFLKRYVKPASYEPKSEAWRKALVERAGELAELGRKWTADGRIADADSTPSPEPVMRITPRE